jgi:nucleotide-binding universal stress UspA family protein
VKRVVIATDGSPPGREAVERGIELAATVGATATIAFVRRSPPALLGEPFYGRALTAELREGRAIVDDAARRAAEAGVPSETEILEGDPAEQILRLAGVRQADVIVVGSRGRGALTGAVLGSVSDAILSGADRPVLVVKEKPAQEQRAA